MSEVASVELGLNKQSRYPTKQFSNGNGNGNGRIGEEFDFRCSRMD